MSAVIFISASGKRLRKRHAKPPANRQPESLGTPAIFSSAASAQALTVFELLSKKNFFSSGDRSPAVQADDLPCDVGTFTGEEMNEVGDVLRRSRATEGDAAQIFLFFFFRII